MKCYSSRLTLKFLLITLLHDLLHFSYLANWIALINADWSILNLVIWFLHLKKFIILILLLSYRLFLAFLHIWKILRSKWLYVGSNRLLKWWFLSLWFLAFLFIWRICSLRCLSSIQLRSWAFFNPLLFIRNNPVHFI